jgi:tetratricopeptide (TPR) repeat protein
VFPAFANSKDLEEIEARLEHAPNDVELLFARACILDALGRNDAARDAYIAVIKRENGHVGALGNLAILLYNAGYRNAAILTYNEALNHDPLDVRSLVNLAGALLESKEFKTARQLYLRALEVEPESAAAHQGLGNVLTQLGEHTLAQVHRRRGFEAMPVVVNPFRGDGIPVSVLLLCAAYRGNMPVEASLDDRTFMVVKLFAEYYDPELPLPPHDAIVNGIGDADLCAGALDAAQELLEAHDAVAINPPPRVRETGRAQIAQSLRDIEGLVVPHIEEVHRDRLEAIAAFPVLLRAAGYHGGEFFERVNDRDALARVAAELPGERFFAIEPLDARGVDGFYRKYRVLAIGGRLYPVHLARSTSWKVHYFSADQTRAPDAIAEETAFLNDMPAAVGPRALRALEEIVRRVELDYFGIDFAIDPAGNVLLFEANATMRAVVRGAASLAANAALRDLVLRAANATEARR